MMYADVACLVQMTRDIEKFYGKLVGASRAAVARVTTLGRAWIELSNASWVHACRQGQASRDYKRTRPRLGGVGRGLGGAGRRPTGMRGATASAPPPPPRARCGRGGAGREGEIRWLECNTNLPISTNHQTETESNEGESNRHRYSSSSSSSLKVGTVECSSTYPGTYSSTVPVDA